MEVQLNELIDKIKTEGVGAAEQKAEEIKKKAEREAAGIVAKARKEAEEIVAKAKAEAARFEETGRESVKHAGRDLVLKLRASITTLFETVVAREIKASLSDDALQEIIPKLIAAWQEKGMDDIQVLLSPADLKKVEKDLLEKLSAEAKKGVEFKPLPEIQAGFRIGEKKGEAYYDFTDKGITEHLVEYLNPKLAECLVGKEGKEPSKKGESGE